MTQALLERLRAHNDGVLCEEAVDAIEALTRERDAMAEAMERARRLLWAIGRATHTDQLSGATLREAGRIADEMKVALTPAKTERQQGEESE